MLTNYQISVNNYGLIQLTLINNLGIGFFGNAIVPSLISFNNNRNV